MSWAIWITGPPGSGKTTLARSVAAALRSLRIDVEILELDEIRKVLTPAPTYSDAEREIVYRALAYMATRLTHAGVRVMVDATAHRRAWRDLARALIPLFAEIQVRCPLDVCRQREATRRPGHAPADIYARGGRTGSTVPGVDVVYEESLHPELTVDTHAVEPAAAVRQVVEMTRHLERQCSASTPP